jgi:hypothetical protein
MQAPRITTAIPRRRYRVGGWQAVLLADIDSPDPARYQYLLALVREGEPRPSFFVSCEKNPRSRKAEGSHRLRVISAVLDEEIESADRFADEEVFAGEALALAAEMLGIREAPERLS